MYSCVLTFYDQVYKMIACIQASLVPRPGFESENEANIQAYFIGRENICFVEKKKLFTVKHRFDQHSLVCNR